MASKPSRTSNGELRLRNSRNEPLRPDPRRAGGHRRDLHLHLPRQPGGSRPRPLRASQCHEAARRQPQSRPPPPGPGRRASPLLAGLFLPRHLPAPGGAPAGGRSAWPTEAPRPPGCRATRRRSRCPGTPAGSRGERPARARLGPGTGRSRPCLPRRSGSAAGMPSSSPSRSPPRVGYDPSVVREPADHAKIRTLLRELGRRARGPGRVYLIGGASALLEGWRSSTVDVDLKLDPEPPGAFEAIAQLKNELDLNVELVSPDNSCRCCRLEEPLDLHREARPGGVLPL